MKIIVNILITNVLLIGGCASGRGESSSRAGYNFSLLDKVAIVAVEGAVKSEPAKNQIAGFFTMELLKKGYSPVERANVEVLLKEKEFQAPDLTIDADAAKAGKILKVPAVLIINIPRFDYEIFITARMIDVVDGSILWLSSGSRDTGGLLSGVSGSAFGAGAGIAVSSKEDELFGGVAGGVLGSVRGYALSPQETEQAQRLIRRMCSSLPSKRPRNRKARRPDIGLRKM
jgi:hypothetical protein